MSTSEQREEWRLVAEGEVLSITTHASERVWCKRVLELLDDVARLERELELAIAHDTQPYPTASAYEAVCTARDKWQKQAERDEADCDAALRHLRAVLKEVYNDENVGTAYDAASAFLAAHDE